MATPWRSNVSAYSPLAHRHAPEMAALAAEREQLVAAAALEAKRLGYQQLWLDVAKHNAAAARLYERVGFRWAEPPPGQAPDDRHCELSMVLGL